MSNLRSWGVRDMATKPPLWIRVWMFVGFASIFATLAFQFSIPYWGKENPEGDWTYQVKFRGKPPVYLERVGAFIQIVSLPVTVLLFLSGGLLWRHTTRKPREGG